MRNAAVAKQNGIAKNNEHFADCNSVFLKNRTIFTKRSRKQNENFYHKSAVSESAAIDEKNIVGYNNSNNRIAEKWRMVKWKTVLLQILA